MVNNKIKFMLLALADKFDYLLDDDGCVMRNHGADEDEWNPIGNLLHFKELLLRAGVLYSMFDDGVVRLTSSRNSSIYKGFIDNTCRTEMLEYLLMEPDIKYLEYTLFSYKMRSEVIADWNTLKDNSVIVQLMHNAERVVISGWSHDLNLNQIALDITEHAYLVYDTTDPNCSCVVTSQIDSEEYVLDQNAGYLQSDNAVSCIKLPDYKMEGISSNIDMRAIPPGDFVYVHGRGSGRVVEFSRSVSMGEEVIESFFVEIRTITFGHRGIALHSANHVEVDVNGFEIIAFPKSPRIRSVNRVVFEHENGDANYVLKTLPILPGF